MAERLQVKVGEAIHIAGKGQTRVESTVLRFDDAGMIALHVPGAAVSVILQYRNGEYYTQAGKIVKLARPLYANAKVKTLKTADGILEIDGWRYKPGHTYQADLMSMAEREYIHPEHPGQAWSRMSITVYDDNGVPTLMPAELFEIETPA